MAEERAMGPRVHTHPIRQGEQVAITATRIVGLQRSLRSLGGSFEVRYVIDTAKGGIGSWVCEVAPDYVEASPDSEYVDSASLPDPLTWFHLFVREAP